MVGSFGCRISGCENFPGVELGLEGADNHALELGPFRGVSCKMHGGKDVVTKIIV